MRLVNGRIRGHHAFSLAVSVGLTIASIAFVIFVLCGGARSQPLASNCFPWERLKAAAKLRYGEVPIGGGLVSGDVVIQVLASPDGETFTIVSIDRNGVACALATGTGWDPGRIVSSKEEAS